MREVDEKYVPKQKIRTSELIQKRIKKSRDAKLQFLLNNPESLEYHLAEKAFKKSLKVKSKKKSKKKILKAKLNVLRQEKRRKKRLEHSGKLLASSLFNK